MRLKLLGLEGATSIDLVAAATAKLSVEEAAAVISTTALTNAQQLQILMDRGLSKEEAEAALATAAHSTANAGATASTFTLTGAVTSLKTAFKGLFATLAANPLILVISAVALLATGISKLNALEGEAAEKAKEQAQASAEIAQKNKEEYDTLDELIAKYKELAESDVQDTKTRAEILDIQTQISNIVGTEADNLDLVNGKLDEELEKLYAIQNIKLGDTISSFEKAYKDAQEATSSYDMHDANWVEDLALYTLGDKDTLTIDYWGDNKNRNKAIDIIDKVWKDKGYGSASIEEQEWDLLGLFWDSWSELKFNEELNSEQRIEALDAAIEALENTEDFDYSNNELWKKLVSIRDEWGGNEGLFTKQTEAAKNLLEALAKKEIGSGKDIKSVDEFKQYQKSIIDAVSGNDVIKQAIEDGSLSQESIETFIGSYLGTIDKYEDVYNRMRKLDTLIGAFNKSKGGATATGSKQFTDWVSQLSDDDLEILYNVAVSTDTANYTLDDWKKAVEGDITYSLNTDDFDKYIEKANGAADSIKNILSVINSQDTGSSLSVEDFNSEELKDYTSALEYHNGVLQLNADKVRDIVNAKSEETIATNNANKALAQSKYLENAGQIEKLRQKIKDKNYAEGESEATIQANIDALLEENGTLKTECDTYDLITNSLQEATNAYNNWLNAQNASQSGDMFDDTIDAINRITETLNDTESEFFGRVGRTDYKAAIDLIIPESVDREDADKVNAYLKSVYDLFTYTEDGDYSGLNIENFCKKAVEKGLMVLDEASESYQIAGQKTMEDFANGMGLSLPLVQAMFGEMEEFGGEFSWADEANKTIGDLAISANVAAENLRKLHSNMSINLDVDASDVDSANSTLTNTIQQMQKIIHPDDKSIKVDPSEVEYANSIISYCVTKMQELENPAILDVDATKVTEISKSAGEAVGLLQEFKTAYNNLELKKTLGVDTKDAQAEVDALLGKISSSNNDYLISLGLDTTSIETLNAAITGLDLPKIKATFNIDDTELKSYTPEDKKATVKYNIDTSKVDSYNPKNLSRTVTYYVRTVGTVNPSTGGTHGLNGSANAGGNWGVKQGGATLTGELGREIVVDPHTGRWYTVGDNGAEFVNIPKGSIVFNHMQTESLLKNGYVAGRASALVGGTAFVTGGIKTSGAKNSTTSGGSSTSNYGNTKSSSSSKSSSSKSSSSSSSDEKEPQEFDWIEVAIDRIERAIDRLKTTATSTYKALKTKLGATASEITKVNQELALQEQAYNRYIQQANSVGLSSGLASQVRNGTIDINEYDEDTKKLIDDYKQWYEKALDCSDAIQELHENLASLYEDDFNNIKDDFDNQLGLLEHLTNTYKTGQDKLEAKGRLESTKYVAALKNVEQQNIGVMNKELNSLIQSFSEAMASGEIEEYSESWYSMQQEINDVKEAIDEANLSLLEYDKTMREINWGYFDYMEDRISQITAESDFLIDLMSNSKMYDDNGQLTNEGLSTMGLHGVNYNVYMAKADDYAAEILKLDKEIANDPYNTDLIERREELLGLQQDSIKAAEDEKQAIVSLVEEGIKVELDSLKELIDNYTNALDSAKD